MGATVFVAINLVPVPLIVSTPIIVHERINEWFSLLRPRLADQPTIRWVESRSTADLSAAVVEGDAAIVVINLAKRTQWGLEGLAALGDTAADPLILVLDPDRVPEVPILARELGATLVWSGVVVPPRVETLFRRWIPLITHRRSPRSLLIAKDV